MLSFPHYLEKGNIFEVYLLYWDDYSVILKLSGVLKIEQDNFFRTFLLLINLQYLSRLFSYNIFSDTKMIINEDDSDRMERLEQEQVDEDDATDGDKGVTIVIHKDTGETCASTPCPLFITN